MSFSFGADSLLNSVAERLIQGDGPECCAACDTQLPSARAVTEVAAEIRELLFPGHHSARSVHAAQRGIETYRRLETVRSRLVIEIGRALQSSGNRGLKVHQEAAEPVERPTAGQASVLADEFLDQLPRLRELLSADVAAAFDGDPAARSAAEIVLCYPGILAVMTYRIAHELHRIQVPLLPRMLTEWAHRETGIDIHPGAAIGPHFFIDHGTGVVIGETCEIGSRVTLYQGVTLGAWSFPRDDHGQLIRGRKRHPTLEDNVVVYSNASILGGSTTVGAGARIGSGVTLSRSIPPNTIVTMESPQLRFRDAG